MRLGVLLSISDLRAPESGVGTASRRIGHAIEAIQRSSDADMERPVSMSAKQTRPKGIRLRWSRRNELPTPRASTRTVHSLLIPPSQGAGRPPGSLGAHGVSYLEAVLRLTFPN